MNGYEDFILVIAILADRVGRVETALSELLIQLEDDGTLEKSDVTELLGTLEES